MMGTKMDLESTADQSCSEPSSVKLNKDVRDDFLKRACAKLAARPLCESCAANTSQSLKSHKKALSTRPFYCACYKSSGINRTALAGWGQTSVLNWDEAAQTIS